MPGYGLLGPEEGSGLLEWAWAEQRLVTARCYWLATVWPDGRPHVMPVWGIWQEDAFWFSSSNGSRKARNLASDPRCTVTTDDPESPVVVEGVAARVSQPEALVQFLAWENTKYKTDYTPDMLDPKDTSCFRVAPLWAFGIRHDDFTGSPTRWRFKAGG